jgi:hypothetical protein
VRVRWAFVVAAAPSPVADSRLCALSGAPQFIPVEAGAVVRTDAPVDVAMVGGDV